MQSSSSSKRGCYSNLTLKERMAPTPMTWAMVPCPSTSTAVKPTQQGKIDEYPLSVCSATDAAKGTSLPAGSPVDSPLVPLSTSLSPDVACCLTVGARPNLPATRKAVVEVTIICSSEQVSGDTIMTLGCGASHQVINSIDSRSARDQLAASGTYDVFW